MKHNKLALLSEGKHSLQKDTLDNAIVSGVKKTFPSGLEAAVAFKVPKYEKKADYAPVLKDLKRMGLTQKASAFIIGASQSYVSTLLKK